MRDLQINCPCFVHKKPVRKQNELGEWIETKPVSKILLIVGIDTAGSVKVQCGDNRCRKASGHKGWFEVILNGQGGYEVKAIPKQWFETTRVPFVVSDA